MAKENVQRVVVTVDDQHVSSIQSVADSLKAAGMEVDNVMSNVGIITGGISENARQALGKIAGVSAVEPDEEMRAI